MTQSHSTNQRADAWTELVFQHRNHDYGAYTLRRDYNRHVTLATLLTIAGTLLLIALSTLLRQTAETPIDLRGKNNDHPPYETITPTIVPPKPPVSRSSSNQKKALTTNIVIVDIDSSNVALDTAAASINNRHNGDSTRAGSNNGNRGGSDKGHGLVQRDTVEITNHIEMLPQVMPEFIGGMDALMKYLAKNIDCPLWRQVGDNGSVIFSLVIGKDGTVSDVQILRDNVGLGCAEQAKQVIRAMPAWKPGRNGNAPVNVRYVLPVRYEKN